MHVQPLRVLNKTYLGLNEYVALIISFWGWINTVEINKMNYVFSTYRI